MVSATAVWPYARSPTWIYLQNESMAMDLLEKAIVVVQDMRKGVECRMPAARCRVVKQHARRKRHAESRGSLSSLKGQGGGRQPDPTEALFLREFLPASDSGRQADRMRSSQDDMGRSRMSSSWRTPRVRQKSRRGKPTYIWTDLDANTAEQHLPKQRSLVVKGLTWGSSIAWKTLHGERRKRCGVLLIPVER